MSVESSNSKMEVVVIDDAGNLSLELQTYGLLVSSRVLSLASPVFTAMLGPKFKEGQVEGPGGTKRINLPEDDEEALCVICYTLHYRTEHIPQRLEPSMAAKVAILCDKYDCVNALKPWALIWLPATAYDARKGVYEILLAAYLLDLPETFSQVSWAIILNQEEPFMQLPLPTGHSLMPQSVLGNPLSHRLLIPTHTLAGDFEARTMEPKLSFWMTILDSAFKLVQPGECGQRALHIAEYIRNLKDCSQPFREPGNHNISFCLDTLATVRKPRHEFCWSAKCQDCKFLESHDITETLRKAICTFLEIKKGICLDCVRTGRQSRLNGTCRHDHSASTLSLQL